MAAGNQACVAAGAAMALWIAGGAPLAGALHDRPHASSTPPAGAAEASAAALASLWDPEWCQGDACVLRNAVLWLLSTDQLPTGSDGAPPNAADESRRPRPFGLPGLPLREPDGPAGAGAASPAAPVECVTAMRPSGAWIPVTCHAGRSAPLPEGPIVQVVHTHPGGTSLSMADLWVLVSRPDVVSVAATTADGRIFLVERGPRFADLARAYPRVLAEANVEGSRRARDRRAPRFDEHAEVNRILASRAIIRYRAERLPATP